MPPRQCFSTSILCRRLMTPAAALEPDAPLLFPEHGSNVCFTTAHGDDEHPLDGADVVAAGDDGESASCRRADGDERHSWRYPTVTVR